MPADFLIAHNPEQGTTLPYLLRIPLGDDGIVLKARETWPRTGKVYCHRAVGWPAAPDLIEQAGVRSCVRRGASIDLVLDRGRENRSQFVLTRIRGRREAIFWQTARTAKQARPAASLPAARLRAPVAAHLSTQSSTCAASAGTRPNARHNRPPAPLQRAHAPQARHNRPPAPLRRGHGRRTAPEGPRRLERPALG